MGGGYSAKSVQAVEALAYRCVRRQPNSRPTMSEAVEILEKITEAYGGDEAVVGPTKQEVSSEGRGRNRGLSSFGLFASMTEKMKGKIV